VFVSCWFIYLFISIYHVVQGSAAVLPSRPSCVYVMCNTQDPKPRRSESERRRTAAIFSDLGSRHSFRFAGYPPTTSTVGADHHARLLRGTRPRCVFYPRSYSVDPPQVTLIWPSPPTCKVHRRTRRTSTIVPRNFSGPDRDCTSFRQRGHLAKGGCPTALVCHPRGLVHRFHHRRHPRLPPPARKRHRGRRRRR